MKKILLLILLSSNAFAECYSNVIGSCSPEQLIEPAIAEAMPEIIDLNNYPNLSNQIEKALVERALRENALDRIDGRFGGQKDPYYYVYIFRKQSAGSVEKGNVVQAVQNSFCNSGSYLGDDQQGKAICAPFVPTDKICAQHYALAYRTIKDFEGQIIELYKKLQSCKKSRGKKC